MTDSSFESRLREATETGLVLADAPLSEHTTFKIGGPADWLVAPRTEGEVCAVVRLCREQGIDLHVLGLGSNVLAADAGVRGVVLKLADNFASVNVNEDACEIVAQAGASNERIAELACAAGLAGYEFASGIPGTVGGAAIMNAGAYDGEFKNVAVAVRCLTPEGEVREVPAAKADWSYRHSMMGECGYIVLEATLRLQRGDAGEIRARMDDLARRRAEKQPLEMPSAGSTFKRPEGYFAGKLIQDAGLRGYRVGGAQVSAKHTGFVVNAGGATAADVLQLIGDVQRKVEAAEGVTLQPEVRMWGFDA